ncbi:hypothetical protein [Cupriavidus pinatubonensis]|uniref:hypothetical protein n=1 Tax=Cupriavidus pinatubonensis TaxID=248026 RepID=UPI00361E487B
MQTVMGWEDSHLHLFAEKISILPRSGCAKRANGAVGCRRCRRPAHPLPPPRCPGSWIHSRTPQTRSRADAGPSCGGQTIDSPRPMHSPLAVAYFHENEIITLAADRLR